MKKLLPGLFAASTRASPQAKRIISLLLSIALFASPLSGFADQNTITLIDQQDREIRVKEEKITIKKGISTVTGLKSKATYHPVLVEFNNENGGIDASAPIGISDASIIYEYQISTNGVMGISALYQDTLPTNVGPLGNASIGGTMVQGDWKCPYVYQDVPRDTEGNMDGIGLSIYSLFILQKQKQGVQLFPSNVGRFKEWKQYMREDETIFTAFRSFVNLKGIQQLSISNNNNPLASNMKFLAKGSVKSDISVMEVDIRLPSRTYSSGFVYNKDTKTYSRFVGQSKYVDGGTGKQLEVSNVIIQRTEYQVADGYMAPNLIGQGNADIFIEGKYIEGYWVHNSADSHTRYYDDNGNPIELMPGKTFISIVTNQTAIVLIDW